MARSVSDIQTQVVGQLVANFSAVGITVDSTKWSKRNIMQLLCFTFATCSAYLEQLMDVLKTSIETTASQSAASSSLWIQAQMFNFQYSSPTPQILQMIGTVPQYPIIDPTLRIITGCSVSSVTPNQVTIKVAKSNPFTALLTAELSAAQGFINLIGTAGVNYTVVSLSPDYVYVQANVYYQGQYSAIIQVNVTAAINGLLQNISVNNFDGALKMSDLENVIRNVPGVNDVQLVNVKCRSNATPFASAISLILNSLQISRLWMPVAGYCTQETTTGNTFADTITYIAQ